jgi:signal transduction histidine kinase
VMLEGRELVFNLRATTTEKNDLPSEFAHYGEQMQQNLSCDFKVVVNGAVRPLHPVVFEEISKIAKESLGNAFRHSAAQSIEMELNYEAGELRICIRDDGVGIDADIVQRGYREGPLRASHRCSAPCSCCRYSQ